MVASSSGEYEYEPWAEERRERIRRREAILNAVPTTPSGAPSAKTPPSASVAAGKAGSAVSGGLTSGLTSGTGGEEGLSSPSKSREGTEARGGNERSVARVVARPMTFLRSVARFYCTIFLLFAVLTACQVYFMWTEELGALEVSSTGLSSLLNASKPAKLTRRIMLSTMARDVMNLQASLTTSMAQLQEQQALLANQTAEALQGVERRLTGGSKRLVDFTRAMGEKQRGEVQALQGRVEEMGRAMARQGELLREQTDAIATLKADLEMRKAASTPPTNYTLYYITDDHPDLWQQRTFRRYASYGFVKFSAYRVSPSLIAILGLSALAMHDNHRLSFCEWHGMDGSVIPGRLEMLYVGEHHNFLYETVVLNCLLDSPVQSPGGYLKARINSEVLYPYREAKSEPLTDPAPPFRHHLLFCGPPMYGTMEPRVILEWLDYHRVYAGADHFVFYDSGAVDVAVRKALEGYLSAGALEITDFREAQQWDAWLWAQSLAIQDCMYRSRRVAEWVFMQDFDEFLEVLPPLTVPALLAKYQGRPWISYGCAVFNSSYCVDSPTNAAAGLATHDRRRNGDLRGGGGAAGGGGGARRVHMEGLLIERMHFRWPHIYCMDTQKYRPEHCLDQEGHRKYILNPRRVQAAQIHIVVKGEGMGEGVDMDTDDMRLAHYRGLATKGARMCELGVPRDWWMQYDRVGRIAAAVWNCPLVASNRQACTPSGIANTLAATGDSTSSQ
ncbi:hypothetical protein CLOM_g10936 [Closterium sp. NIES-68]|nr:hypothetical protein CLOM_g10936 [Closterium sp. NIES-68]GJP57800.1 hypothetical protein CLOP_g17393 [Closterium sp. NIES-67]